VVDEHLPGLPDPGPLRYLFLDLNSYFASVEQQEHPELRGRPVAVVPVEADTSFVIAASYEAKAFGVKTGTKIGDAKQMCPDLLCVKGNHPMYRHYHDLVIEVAETVLPVEEVCSIDELRFRLLGEEREPENALALGREMKRAIRDGAGECLTCSVGIAPNAFLSKIGTELEKPDGLVVIEAGDLPEKLHALRLTDFTGINRRMEVRLNAAGIFTAEQLCAASRLELHNAFGSIVGEHWWYMLRGYDLGPETHGQKSLGHSHVLPPALRTDDGSREVLLRLLQKASARLRSHNLWTSSMTVAIKGFKRSWSATIKLPPTQDTVTLNEHFLKAWESRDFDKPQQASVTFHELREAEHVTLSLFDETVDRAQFSRAVDTVNSKFGKNSVYLAGMEHAKDTAEERIAFNKTWLFQEGKGDNEWVDTFRGRPRKKKGE
jgi:DNA polymerase IV